MAAALSFGAEDLYITLDAEAWSADEDEDMGEQIGMTF